LEHIANPLKAINEWLRIIKNGGYVIIIVPEKSCCFDHKRNYSKFSTLLSQYEKNVGILVPILRPTSMNVDLHAWNLLFRNSPRHEFPLYGRTRSAIVRLVFASPWSLLAFGNPSVATARRSLAVMDRIVSKTSAFSGLAHSSGGPAHGRGSSSICRGAGSGLSYIGLGL